MRKLKSASTALVAALSTMLVAPLAMAQSTTPTTATQLAQSVDLSDAKAAGLIIIGLLIGLGVVLWGARLVASKFGAKV